MSDKSEYTAFGEEWRREMMKLSKGQLIDFVKSANIKRLNAIAPIKAVMKRYDNGEHTTGTDFIVAYAESVKIGK